MITKINELEIAVNGAEILFLAGEYADCLDQLCRAIWLENACIHGYFGIPPCRDKEVFQNGLTKQQFIGITYIYYLGDKISDIKLALKSVLKNDKQFNDFLPIGIEDAYYWPRYYKDK